MMPSTHEPSAMPAPWKRPAQTWLLPLPQGTPPLERGPPPKLRDTLRQMPGGRRDQAIEMAFPHGALRNILMPGNTAYLRVCGYDILMSVASSHAGVVQLITDDCDVSCLSGIQALQPAVLS